MRTGNSKHPPTSACSSAPLGAAGVRRLEGVKQLQVMWTEKRFKPPTESPREDSVFQWGRGTSAILLVNFKYLKINFKK